ncbi:MAG: hypothetical protein F6K11_35020 [Leptolyngbya sp. SIO3F4]|nr:hypothetical protein [Leptolyngbya sp. SIO3F4]
MMTSSPLKSIKEHFKSHASNLAGTWLSLMQENQYHKASKLCIDFLETYSSAFKARSLEIDGNGYNKLLMLLVFFKGLHEYVQLCQITGDRNWYEEQETVEKVWIKLCDCRERLHFSSQYCQGEAINRVLSDLDGLEGFFQEAFGNGSYLSPGIVADMSLCSICNQDCRACSHVAGRLYNGEICSYQPVNPHCDHVALVKIPKDLRCRIWSWQIKDNDDESITIERACILTSFSVDDFLQDSAAAFL